MRKTVHSIARGQRYKHQQFSVLLNFKVTSVGNYTEEYQNHNSYRQIGKFNEDDMSDTDIDLLGGVLWVYCIILYSMLVIDRLIDGVSYGVLCNNQPHPDTTIRSKRAAGSTTNTAQKLRKRPNRTIVCIKVMVIGHAILRSLI